MVSLTSSSSSTTRTVGASRPGLDEGAAAESDERFIRAGGSSRQIVEAGIGQVPCPDQGLAMPRSRRSVSASEGCGETGRGHAHGSLRRGSRSRDTACRAPTTSKAGTGRWKPFRLRSPIRWFPCRGRSTETPVGSRRIWPASASSHKRDASLGINGFSWEGRNSDRFTSTHRSPWTTRDSSG
jgi:hypothetical protein